MICQRCVLRLRSSQSLHGRFLTTSRPLLTEPIPASRGPASGSHEGPPAAASTSAAQPFTASMTPSEPPQNPITPSPVRIKSSVKAGTPFKGLNFFKNKDPPVAMEDHEYPDWLWTLLDKSNENATGAANPEADVYAKTKRMRRLGRRAEKKAAKLAELDPSANMPKIPLEHQTIDLPGGDGSVAGAVDASKARNELTAAMRKSRRKTIKEANFLKGM